jgi:ABC-type antimicrobial peptide transport system permease subunit
MIHLRHHCCYVISEQSAQTNITFGIFFLVILAGFFVVIVLDCIEESKRSLRMSLQEHILNALFCVFVFALMLFLGIYPLLYGLSQLK